MTVPPKRLEWSIWTALWRKRYANRDYTIVGIGISYYFPNNPQMGQAYARWADRIIYWPKR